MLILKNYAGMPGRDTLHLFIYLDNFIILFLVTKGMIFNKNDGNKHLLSAKFIS